MNQEIRVLLMDDKITSTHDIICRTIEPMLNSQTIAAFAYGKTYSTALSFQDHTIQFHLHCCLNSDPHAEKESILAGAYDEHLFDLVLLDDNWTYEEFGGQDILLEPVLNRIRGRGNIPNVCYWTEHYADPSRLERLSSKISNLNVRHYPKIYYCHKADTSWLQMLVRKIAFEKLCETSDKELSERLIGNRTAVTLFREYGSSNHLSSPSLEDLLKGTSSHVRGVRELIHGLSSSDVTVLIEGETGTGKQLVAKDIHNKCKKTANNVFVHVDVSRFRNTDGAMLQSELFGHVKGAFTGAVADKKGLVEEAKGGTLFLDEIENLDGNTQAQLLLLLQEKIYYRLGDSKPMTANVRIIAASNKPLAKLVHDGSFREDLMYRLDLIPISLLPLRDRHEDIPALFMHFYNKYASTYNIILDQVDHIDNISLLTMSQYHWPGNIRQLENFVSRMQLLVNKEKHFNPAVLSDLISYERRRYGEPKSVDLRKPEYFEVFPRMLRWEEAAERVAANLKTGEKLTQSSIAATYKGKRTQNGAGGAPLLSKLAKEEMFKEALKRRADLFPYLRQVFLSDEKSS